MASRFKQLQYQSETWKRDLGFMAEENVTLKNRLAEILSEGHVTPEFLEKAEAYQTGFITKDEARRLILSEIKEWDKLFAKEIFLDSTLNKKKLISSQKKLSHAIEDYIKDFNRLKFDFNNYMTEVI